MSYISLTTDFGARDGNVGVMKGVIYRIAPDVKIIDISHEIGPQDVFEAAFTLSGRAYYFPENTIHIVVVDPGVGTARRPIAAQIGPQRFIGPDNGVLTPLLARAESENWPVKIVHTDKAQYWLPEISHVFHGRDIFAPVGAHWTAGVPLEELGAPINDPVRIHWPLPERTAQGWVGEVVHIDHFGNVISNIRQADLAGMGDVNVTVGETTIEGLVRTFGERDPGALAALFGSTGHLLVSVVNGSGAERLAARHGDVVTVTPRQ